MIQGYFSTGTRRRPYVSGRLRLPTLNNQVIGVEFLMDTGADRTILSSLDVERVGIDLTTLPLGLPSKGVGGQASTRAIEAVLSIQYLSTPLTLPILETQHPIPSLLGRDIISRFALFMEERTSRVLLLEPREADDLNLS